VALGGHQGGEARRAERVDALHDRDSFDAAILTQMRISRNMLRPRWIGAAF
jgi:hypothetical protein